MEQHIPSVPQEEAGKWEGRGKQRGDGHLGTRVSTSTVGQVSVLLSTPEPKRESLTRCTEHMLICPVNGNKDDSEGARLFRVSQNQEEQARVGYRPGGGQAF